ncbi:hypothetical protein AAVH_32747 [Aphelenchoides avenae]|nr:hypothetical protein AAVH_32747 [Aphelenchus avenae]
MATLLRTGGAAKKLITGFRPSGAAPAVVPAKRVVHTDDLFAALLTTDTLQAKTARVVPRGPMASTLRLAKGINVSSNRLTRTDVTSGN